MQIPGGIRPEEPGNLTYPWRYNARRAWDKKGDKMVKIVHWKDIVGQENLEVFTRIEKAIIVAERSGHGIEEVFKRLKGHEDEIEMWRKKRYYMRYCGFDEKNRQYGWFKSYLDGGEIKFKTTAPPKERKYITLSEFLEYKRQHEQETIEAEYYGEINSFSDDYDVFVAEA